MPFRDGEARETTVTEHAEGGRPISGDIGDEDEDPCGVADESAFMIPTSRRKGVARGVTDTVRDQLLVASLSRKKAAKRGRHECYCKWNGCHASITG